MHRMFPINKMAETYTEKEKLEDIYFDAERYKQFYHNQFMKAHRVIDLTIVEKNKLLHDHDADFFDPAHKKRDQFDGKLNKIKGEVVVKIDHFEFPE